MSDYSVVANVSNGIVNILRTYLVPDIIQNSAGILLCSPIERGDAVITVFLYDVKEDERMQENKMMYNDIHQQTYPSIFLKLSYMISVFSSADIKYRTSEELKIMGAVMQIINDNFLISPDTYELSNDSSQNNIRIEMNKLLEEEKYRIFSLPNMPYKTSVFYTASPVEIKSRRKKKISRVKEFDVYHYEK